MQPHPMAEGWGSPLEGNPLVPFVVRPRLLPRRFLVVRVDRKADPPLLVVRIHLVYPAHTLLEPCVGLEVGEAEVSSG